MKTARAHDPLINRIGLWAATRLGFDIRTLRHSQLRFYRRRDYGGVACVQVGRILFMKVVGR